MARPLPPADRHYIRKWATEARVDGERKVVHCFSCGPCEVRSAAYPSRAARDRAVEQHLKS